MGGARPIRARLNTSVGKVAFIYQSVRSGVRVPLMARLRALMTLSTGQLMRVGYSPLADVKEEAVNANANVDYPCSNHIRCCIWSSDKWIHHHKPCMGRASLLCGMCLVFVGVDTLIVVLVILVVNETSTMDQARYMKSIADAEFLTPLKLFIMLHGLVVSDCCTRLVGRHHFF